MTSKRGGSVELGIIDPAIWRVLVGDEVYGPYTRGQVLAFIREGRVAPDTRIASGHGSAFISAGDCAEFAEAFGPLTDTRKSPPTNYLIASRIAGSRMPEVNRVLNQLGRFAEVAPGMFVMRSTVSLARIRQHIELVIEKDDQVIIVDATHNRIGHIHLGPECDARVRQVWDARLG